MRNHRRLNWKAFLTLALALSAAAVAAVLFLPGRASSEPARAVREAWSLMQQAGLYEFSTTVEQTTYPAPKLVNVGRTSTKEVYYASGSTDLRNRTMQIGIWQNDGSLLNAEDAINVRVENDKAYARTYNSDWKEIDNFSTTSFAPGQDASAYLVAAQNTRLVGSEKYALPDGAVQQVSRYTFDLDSDRYATYLRDQMAAELQRAGKLPIGMNLSISDSFKNMEGQGSLLVDESGLPVRMQVEMKLPPSSIGERVEIKVKTDFFGQKRENLLANQPLPARLAGMLGLYPNRSDLSQALVLAGFAGSLLALLVLATCFANNRVVYGAVAILVIVAMVGTPLWQSVKAAEFTRELAVQQESARAEQEETAAQKAYTQELQTSQWDASKDPRLSSEAPASSKASPDAAPVFTDDAAPLAAEDSAESDVDTDGDGLTDAEETRFNQEASVYLGTQIILDPLNADTDNDRLNDGEEVSLNLSTAQPDTDFDGLPDYNEVVGFYNGIQMWYSNPLDKDTDKDGNLDGLECPERASDAGAACRDTDGDNIPDIFDTDDDGDLVPSVVDESPYLLSMRSTVFSAASPFILTVSNLAADRPVFVTYQVRPANPEHLAYALTMLDWPTGDTDGQVQRVSDSTFADTMFPQQAAADPRAGLGDMRMLPMLEVKLRGDALPLPMTNRYSFDWTDNGITAAFSLTSKSSGVSTLALESLSGRAAPVSMSRASGSCVQFSSEQGLGSMSAGSTVDIPGALGAYAEGGNVLLIKGGDGKVAACGEIPPAAHGTLMDKVVDDSVLLKYGASARQNLDHSVLVYAPLSLVYSTGGDIPVAFSSHIPFSNEGSRFNNSTQEARLVWLINMLTDVCKPQPEGSTETDWCSASKTDHWYTNLPTVVQTYSDDFTITGLSVEEEHGLDMAVVFENPAADVQPGSDDPMWMLAKGLEASFISGRSTGGVRDVTVGEIEHRFDPDNAGNNNSGIPAGDVRLWGQPKNAFQVVRQQFGFADQVYQFIETGSASLFAQYFNMSALPAEKQITQANLLFARETSSRMISLGEEAVSCAGSACSFNFNGSPLVTNAILNWAPYQFDGKDWKPYPLEDYLDNLEARLRGLGVFTAEDATDAARKVVDGQIKIARLYYQGVYQGLSKLVEVDGIPAINFPDVVDDLTVVNEFYVEQGHYKTIAKVVKGVAEMIYKGLHWNAGLMSSSIGFGKNIKGMYQAFAEEAGRKWDAAVTKLGRAGAVIVGVAAAIMVVVIVATLIWSLADPDSQQGRNAARAMRITIGLLTASLSLASFMTTTRASFELTAKASQKAAIIGLVIGVVITWGVFFAVWADSGAAAGSLAANNMAADAIAATITLVLLAALSCTGVGTLIVAVIGIIDGLIMLVCAATGWDQDEGSWQKEYLCIGITGWITKIIKWGIYSSNYLVNYSDQDRLSFSNLDQGVTDALKGMTVGNRMTASIKVSNTIELSDIPFDWKAAAYWWQYSGSNARSSSFVYKLQPTESDIHSGLSRGSNSNIWVSVGGDTWEGEFMAVTDSSGITMPAPGINRDPKIYFSEGSAIPVQECIAIPIWPFFMIPICWIRTERASFHTDMSTSFTVDVFPNTLDEFFTLTNSGSGYALAWSQNTTLRFPALKDADGDGLSGNNDPNDDRYDSDGDGLSDLAETREGTNPALFDTDDDGLWDAAELSLGTSPFRKDTDGDGLTDQEELDGWFFTYGFEADGTPLETMVYPDPLSPDFDGDTLTDFQERLYGFHPAAVSNANILDYDLSMRELDSPLIALRFDEANSPMVFSDSSGLGFSASCDVIDFCPDSVGGRFAAAARFDGEDLLVLTGSSDRIQFTGTAPFAIGAWVYPQGEGTLLSKWSDAAGGQQDLRLSLNSSGNLVLASSSAAVVSAGIVNQDAWSHVSASYDGSQVTFYINGAAESPVVWSGSPAPAAGTTPSPIMVGGYSGTAGTTGFFTGRIDELMVFDRALTPEEVSIRMVEGRYNLNDTVVRPGEQVEYTSTVKNQLNSRFAYGLLSTTIDKVTAIVDWVKKLVPKTFVLYPYNPVVDNTQVFTDTLEIASDAQSGQVTISQQVNAQIVDRRTESNMAELWLMFNEDTGASTFVDSSGNMPPRNAVCTLCPTSGETGALHNAVLFPQGSGAQVNIPTLEKMKLVDRSYTLSMWVKPEDSGAAGAQISLLGSTGSRLALGLQRIDVGVEAGNYVPTFTVNSTGIALSAGRTLISGLWNHLAVQYDMTTGELNVFVNGILSASAGSVPVVTLGGASTAGAWVGGTPQGADAWVDDVRIFSRPLTTMDINRLAERPVLQLYMDASGYGDTSGYQQVVNPPFPGIGYPEKNLTGIRGQAMSPGTGWNTSYLKINGNSMLDLHDGAFTISTWVYPVAQPGDTWQGIWGYRGYDNKTPVDGSYPVLERKGTDVRFGFDSGESGSAYLFETAAGVLTENRWNHLVVTFQPTSETPVRYAYKLYVNAVPVDSTVFDKRPRSASTFLVGQSSQAYEVKVDNYHIDYSDGGWFTSTYINEHGNHEGEISRSTTGWWSFLWDVTINVNHTDTVTNIPWISYEVWQDDYSSGDDYCGGTFHGWFTMPGVYTTNLSGCFSGTLTTSVQRPSTQFRGYIDELEMYRYALDTEQVGDLYDSIPLTARLPLDDRPASQTFDNRASLLAEKDGKCTGQGCPAAGTLGLINQAVRFDGENDVIAVPVSTTNDYMVSLWVNSTCPDCGIYTLQSDLGPLNQLYFRSGNVCSMTGTTRLCTRGGSFADGEWHHVVYANNGTVANLWLDGMINNSLYNPPRVAQGPNEQALLGRASSAASPVLNGQLDDVRIFSYSQAEDVVAQLYQRSPIFLAHLDEESPELGLQDATPRDWYLECLGGACPMGGSQGRLGAAVEFDGDNDALSLHQAAFSNNLQSFTLSLWVMPTATLSRPQTIWAAGYPSNAAYKYSLAIVPDSMSVCVLDGQANQACIANSNVELIKNVWNYVTLSVERSAGAETYRLYINGYLDSTGTRNSGSGLIADGLGKLVLGNTLPGFANQAGGAFVGKIDEVSLYAYLLNEIDVRDAFRYQMSEVEEHDSLTMTVDADAPSMSFASYNDLFPYMKLEDRIFHLEASDEVSGINMVEILSWRGEPGEAPEELYWQSAPVCLDSASGTSYCPTFDPQQGDGVYTMLFKAVDRVGHATDIGPYLIYVDAKGPRITSNFADGSLHPAVLDQSRKHTWTLTLSGSISDPTLSDGLTGSGVDPASVTVTLYSGEGDVAGSGTQIPALTPDGDEYQWSIDYVLPEKEPTGRLRVVVQASDLAGNASSKTFEVLLDATKPTAKLESGLPPAPVNGFAVISADQNPILVNGTLSGSSSDTAVDGLPYVGSDGANASSGVAKVEVSFTPPMESSALFNEPYPDGLLAWLPFDSADVPLGPDGNPDPQSSTRRFLDISPFQSSGVCTLPDCPDVMTSAHKAGSAYFSGGLQSVNLGQMVDLAQRSFTVSVWAQREEAGRADPILWQGPVSMPDERFLFGLNEADHFVCGFGGTDLVTPETYTDQGWHHWVCAYNLETQTRAIYRDGAMVASDTASPVRVSNENLFVGLAPVGSFKGSLDELVVLDRALDGAGIRLQYTGYQSVFHLTVESDWLTRGDGIGDRSGYFQTSILEAADSENRVVPGAVGSYALRFTGGDRVVVDPYDSLLLERGSFSQTAWIFPEGSGERDIFSQRDENPEQRYPSLVLTGDNRLKVGFGSGFDWLEASSEAGVVEPGVWSHVAATFDGKMYRAYVNGVEVLAASTFDGQKPYPADRFNLGEGFIGRIDDAQIFTRALSQLEVQAMAAQGWAVGQLVNGQSWQKEVAYGLEGPYEIGVRAWDAQGHVRTEKDIRNPWGGLIDTLSPRLMVTREFLNPDQPYLATYTFSVEDTMLDETTVRQNLCTGVTLEKEYYNSSWFLALGSNPPNSALYRVSARCESDIRTNVTTGFYACDAGGNCSAKTYPPYLENNLFLPQVACAGCKGKPGMPQEVTVETRQMALAWPLLSDTVVEPAGDAPQVGIITGEVNATSLRSPFNANLQGWVSGQSQNLRVDFRILKDGVEVYAGRAAVYYGLWNASWVFPPGQVPTGGMYTLEVTVTNGAGQQSQVSQPITVQLKP